MEWFFGLLTPAQWDALRNWLTAIGGLAALFIAVITYNGNVRNKREEQARLVYADITRLKQREVGEEAHDRGALGVRQGIHPAAKRVALPPDQRTGEMRSAWIVERPALDLVATVHNRSKELIGPIRLQLTAGDDVIQDPSARIEAIEPESEYSVQFILPNPVHPAFQVPRATILYRDASGRWWRRHRAEPIERVHSDPENAGPTPAERIRIRKQQAAIGIAEADRIAEPRVSLGVRWHRFWRRARGKSPLP
ncbi:hypothetical protein ACWGST_16090 [Agromyces sp. NPDC055520]